jgi:hypothetical protein
LDEERGRQGGRGGIVFAVTVGSSGKLISIAITRCGGDVVVEEAEAFAEGPRVLGKFPDHAPSLVVAASVAVRAIQLRPGAPSAANEYRWRMHAIRPVVAGYPAEMAFSDEDPEEEPEVERVGQTGQDTVR